MLKMKKWLWYIVAALVAWVVTPWAVKVAFEDRGGLYFGGEWLLVPLALGVVLFCGEVWDLLCDVLGDFGAQEKEAHQ